MKASPLAAILLGVFVCVLAGCGSSNGISPDKLAGKTGAVSCAPEDYQVVNRIDGSKDRLYSCDMGYGRTVCVTYEGGVARNVTAEARLLWQGTLGADRPACLG